MELQGDIMNISVNRDKMFNAIYESLGRDGGHDMCELAYKLGHRDARHDASELAIAHDTRIRDEARAEALKEAAERAVLFYDETDGMTNLTHDQYGKALRAAILADEPKEE